MELSTNCLFTKCSHCQRTNLTTLEELRITRGVMRCHYCLQIFDGLRSISENISNDEELEEQDFPWKKKALSHKAYWKPALLVVGLLLLATQLFYFNRVYFLQTPIFRAKLETLCRLLPCTLPLYANIKEFKVLQSSFNFIPEQGYIFNAMFANQSEFSQLYPKIKLSLQNLQGVPFAERVFVPQDYLPRSSTNNTVAPQVITTITIKIATPGTNVGGYTFDFIE